MCLSAIDIDPQYYDQLWVKDGRFENISGAVVIIGNEKSPLNEIGFENAVLKNVPVFARVPRQRQEGRRQGPHIPRRTFQLWTHPAGRRVTGALGMVYDATP